MAKAIKTGLNQKQKKFALVEDHSTFAVYALCANYAGHVRGGIAYSWRVVAKGLTRDDAEKLFTKRLAGKA